MSARDPQRGHDSGRRFGVSRRAVGEYLAASVTLGVCAVTRLAPEWGYQWWMLVLTLNTLVWLDQCGTRNTDRPIP
jgi:hypothetical protein